jgi:DNA primase
VNQSIPQNFIDDLLNRTDIVDFIGERIALKKAGSSFVGLCPFHQEKSPSFHVNPQKQFYHCFGCKASGNIISFLIQYDHLSFPDAIETLAQRHHLPIPYDQKFERPDLHEQYALLEEVAKYYYETLSTHKIAIDYLKSRGITGDTAKQFQIGYAPPGWDNLLQARKDSKDSPAFQHLLKNGLILEGKSGNYYDRFRSRIMFPIRDKRGRVIAFGGRVIDPHDEPKYLNSPETPLFHKGQEIYGLYECLQHKKAFDYLFVVEGYMDVIALAQHGIPNAVATLGTSTTKEHITKLLRIFPKLLFCFDGDHAGKQAAWRALKNSLPILRDEWEIRFMFLAEGEDPDSLVRRIGSIAFNQLANKAKSLDQFFFDTLKIDLDLSSIGGKAQLKTQASPLIESMPAGVYQQILYDELARILRIDSQHLKKFTSPQKNQKISSLIQQLKPNSPIRIALSVLLQYPYLISALDLSTTLPVLSSPDIEIKGADLLIELLSLLEATPTLTTGALLEHWREQPFIDKITQLATVTHLFPESGAATELAGAIERLKQQAIEQKIDKLIAKANLNPLNLEEKIQLNELLRQQNQLKEKID